ncbi:thiol-disulfide isomerase/thioredoxin [Lewinella marina]|uniref:Thioredoxin domain-containing protein n=1 Tax=Neolewinella marina TaxID=438751 RepID=A0A2G0CDR9_9BACT|nr:thioredoxin family protein [Neolewinella marina]NJB85892.1 thiol-disulfide isomerase/thioredoxin [Neolewinella marina]PHK98131.1 hypothetical protein CGL56_13155 [Neolewinella marina]
MKYLTLLPLLLSLSLSAQESEGIVFAEQPFEDLLARARAEDKLIFIDAYTTWCGPCKMMTAKVFPDPEVGKVYNDRFINAKFNMERGEGIDLARRYSVAVYPTYLFVNGEGELVHRGIGYIPKPALLELADVAVSDLSLGALENRYQSGDRDPEFMATFAQALAASNEEERADRLVSDFLDTQKDWTTPSNLRLLVTSPGQVGSQRMNFLIEHATLAETTLEAGIATQTIQRALVNDYHRRNRKRSLVAPEEIAGYYAENAGELADQLHSAYALIYYERTGDMESYLPRAMEHYSTYPSEDYTELNSLAWTFFEESDDPKQLAQAIEWAEKSVALRTYYPNLDTLAWLYHKTGQQDKAEATATRAIEYAKADSLDYTATLKIFQ